MRKNLKTEEKDIVVISVLNCYSYTFLPVAAGDTIELAKQVLEEERNKFIGAPVDFDTTKPLRIKYRASSYS